MFHRAKPVGRQPGWWADFLHTVRLAWRLLWDARVPLVTKAAVPALTLLYVFSPIDLAPDLLPLLGQIDDLVVLLIGSRLFISLCPPDVVQWHERQMAGETHPADGEETNDTVLDATFRVVEDDKP